MKNLSIIFLIFCFFGQINTYSQTKTKTASDIYSKKSLELIRDILSDEYNTCDCILQPPQKPTLQAFEDEVPHFNYEKYLLETFGLTEKSDIENLHGINEELILEPNNFPRDIKIIYRSEWNAIFSKYGFNARDTIFKRYPNLCYLTKPIFDKEYKTAIITIDYGGCLWFPPSRIQQINGTWEYY